MEFSYFFLEPSDFDSVQFLVFSKQLDVLQLCQLKEFTVEGSFVPALHFLEVVVTGLGVFSADVSSQRLCVFEALLAKFALQHFVAVSCVWCHES